MGSGKSVIRKIGFLEAYIIYFFQEFILKVAVDIEQVKVRISLVDYVISISQGYVI